LRRRFNEGVTRALKGLSSNSRQERLRERIAGERRVIVLRWKSGTTAGPQRVGTWISNNCGSAGISAPPLQSQYQTEDFMTVCSDYVGYARLGVSTVAILTYLFHGPQFHWLIGSIFAGSHVAMTAARAVFAVVLIEKTLLARLGISVISLGWGGSALLAVALPALRPRFRQPEPKQQPESGGRALPLGLALLAGFGSLGAANLAAGTGLVHFALAIASFPIICAAVWALRELAEKRAN
jgi:hypothetical protein